MLTLDSEGKSVTEYTEIFTKHLERYKELQERERRIQTEKEGVMEMLKASFTMMTDDERQNFLAAMQTVLEQAVKQEMGLTDAIRNLLASNPKEWFGPTTIRDKLQESGFDFSGYQSNPLASVHTVLKRFKRTEVKSRKNAAGMQEYRWAKRPAIIGKAYIGRVTLAPVPTMHWPLGDLEKKKEP